MIGTGSHDTKDGLVEGPYTFFARGIDTMRLDTYDFDETAIVTAGDGAGVGKVIHYFTGKYALHQRAYRICPNNKVVRPRYLYHFFCSTFYDYIMKQCVNSSVASIRRKMLDNYEIPVPPLEEQERIVSILDKFDALVNDISQGIPAEIEARRKQYAY
ncbi:MAG: restriction endonuclease subunit S, partial [Eggerthellaceae bacterium]|nr:restriction endonuclease subunit S [Eggerthellaceae bacterium]